jgi:hypothetical protein
VGADDSLLFRFRKHVHGAAVAVGPVGFGYAVHEADVEVVGAEFAAEAVEIGAHGGGIACPGFCQHGDFVARHVLERFGDMGMASVRIGSVEEAQAMVVSVEKEIGEALDAERGLMRMVSGADGAGAHGETAGLDAGAAESDCIGCGEFVREGCVREAGENGFR